MSEQFFRSNRPGYPHPVSSELENSAIRMAVGDCSVTERRRWRPPDQTGKAVHVHAKHYKHNEDGRTAPGVCGNGSVSLSHSGNVVMRIGIHTHKSHCQSSSSAQRINEPERNSHFKVYGYTTTSSFLQRGTTFVTSCLLSWTMQPFQNRVYS